VFVPASSISSTPQTTWLPDGNATSLDARFAVGGRESTLDSMRSAPDVGAERTCRS
jgi:hypothetical protein